MYFGARIKIAQETETGQAVANGRALTYCEITFDSKAQIIDKNTKNTKPQWLTFCEIMFNNFDLVSIDSKAQIIKKLKYKTLMSHLFALSR